MGPRTYLLCVAALTGGLLALVAGLNLAMDPWGVGAARTAHARAAGWTPELDRMPDRGLASRVAAARRGGVEVVLIGTSRTMHGFAPAPGRLNAGLGNASLDEMRRIARAAAASADPPRRMVIEAATLLTIEPERRRFLAGPSAAERLLSTVATETSLRRLLGPAEAPYRFDVTPAGEARRREMSSRLPIAPGVGAAAYLDGAVAELGALCRAGGGHAVIHEPPVGPALRDDPAVRRAVAARVAAYRAAVARAAPGPCRPVFVDLSGLWGDPIPAAADPALWRDSVHFGPVVGEAVLSMLLAEGPGS